MPDNHKVIVAVGATALLATAGAVAYYFMTNKGIKTGTGGQQVLQLTLSANPTTVNPGGTVQFTVNATDAVSGKPVSGVTVTLQDVTTNTNVMTEMTDSSGNAVFNYTIPSSMTPGQYTFQAVS